PNEYTCLLALYSSPSDQTLRHKRSNRTGNERRFRDDPAAVILPSGGTRKAHAVRQSSGRHTFSPDVHRTVGRWRTVHRVGLLLRVHHGEGSRRGEALSFSVFVGRRSRSLIQSQTGKVKGRARARKGKDEAPRPHHPLAASQVRSGRRWGRLGLLAREGRRGR